MTFQQKNTIASLVSFTLVLGYYLVRLFQLTRGGEVDPVVLFRLWGWVIGLAITGTILVTILAQIVFAVAQAVETGDDDPKIEDIQDERDQLIDLKGTRVAYIVSSIGVFLSMLTFVFGQPPLVMFSLLIFFSLVAQIVESVSRLALYRRGF